MNLQALNCSAGELLIGAFGPQQFASWAQWHRYGKESEELCHELTHQTCSTVLHKFFFFDPIDTIAGDVQGRPPRYAFNIQAVPGTSPASMFGSREVRTERYRSSAFVNRASKSESHVNAKEPLCLQVPQSRRRAAPECHSLRKIGGRSTETSNRMSCYPRQGQIVEDMMVWSPGSSRSGA